MRVPMLVSAASESDLNMQGLLEQGFADDGLIDDELPTEASATLTPAVTQKCPACSAPINFDAVLCIACGYDRRSGDVLETVSEEQLEKGEARSNVDFLKRGAAVSFLFVMLGASIWFGLAIVMNIGVKVGYPAILVGILAGLGMKRGYGQLSNKATPDFTAGMVATIMALVGIFAAKGLIFDHLRSKVAETGKSGTLLEEVADGFSPSTMMGMFKLYDILFIAVAMGAAYALARGDHAQELKNTA